MENRMLIFTVVGAVALVYLYMFSQQCVCEAQPAVVQPEVVQPEVQQQFYGTEQVESRFGNVIGQVYAIFAIFIVTYIFYAIYQTPAIEELRKRLNL